jgi:uncharacterized protein (TIGR03435 family)
MRLLTLFVCSLAVYAQEFEVASIKASAPFPTSGGFRIAPRSGGPGTNDPTHYTWPSATLNGMLLLAYDIKNFQISGPEWLFQERFDVSLVIPEGATKEQVMAMWRNLLAARFGVKVRIEKKEFPVDDLVIGPRGHKLKETSDPDAAPFTAAGNSPFDKDGKLNGAGLVRMMRSSPTGVTAQMNGKAQLIAALVTALSNDLGHPVVDKTGLTGKYDFLVDYAPANARLNGSGPLEAAGTGATPAAADVGLDLAAAVQQQLGLRLERSKGMLDYIVVEKAERVPTEN